MCAGLWRIKQAWHDDMDIRLGIFATIALLMAATSGLCADTMVVAVMARPHSNQVRNSFYGGDRPPLLPSPLISLPFGTVKPRGWLRKQLELERDGFTGHLTEISPFCNTNNNAWLSPDGVGAAFWEEVPYWFRGFAALAYVLDDTNLVQQAQPWIEAAIASQAEFGYFGTRYLIGAPTHPAVPANMLTTPDGRPGLLGEYFDGQDFKTRKATRIDKQIDFNWKEEPPIEGLPAKDYSVRWTGFITARKSGDYIFSLYSDDGARLWINDQLVLDDWGVHVAATTPAKTPVHLDVGRRSPVKLEYFQAAQGSQIRLGWKMPGACYEPRTGPDLMPNMSMMFALRAYAEYSGDKRILRLLTRYFDWERTVPDKLFFSGGWQVPRNGDNLDSVYWLFNITGDTNLLELSAKLMRTGSSWMGGHVGGGHNVDYSQGFRKPGQFYAQAKDSNYLQATEGNYDSMYDVYGQVPGGMFCGDEFARQGYTDPQNAIETCGTVDMMLSQEILLRATGDTKWADRCETIAFNTLPASFTADMKALRYLTSPNQVNSDRRSKYPVLADGGEMQVMDPYSHRCCQHNSGMGWPYFAQNLWQATPDNGLAAVMYAPSEVNAKVGDGTKVGIAEETKYPFDGALVFSVSTKKPVAFPLYFRVPAWCEKPVFTVNGATVNAAAEPGKFLMVRRTWANGDKVGVSFPMPAKVKTWPKQKNAVSIERGPLTFSVKIAEKYVTYKPERTWAGWEIKPDSPWNYGLVVDTANPAQSLKMVAKPWPKDDQPFKWDQAPIELSVTAKKIPNWTENYWGTIDKLQPSPIKSSEPVERITMIPMGAGRLRVSQLPLIGDGPDAKAWEAFPEPIASATHPAMPMEAMWDGKVPSASNDRTVPHFSWWPNANSIEYVIWKFDKTRTVSQTEVYWYIDEDGTTTPEWWKLYYKDGKTWVEVKNPSGYGLEKDKFNVVTFSAVTTTAIKLETKLGGRSGGISEWRVK